MSCSNNQFFKKGKNRKPLKAQREFLFIDADCLEFSLDAEEKLQ